MGFRKGGLRHVGIRGVSRPRHYVANAILLARAGLGHKRSHVSVESSRVLGNRAAAARRLDRAVDRSAANHQRQPPIAIAPLARLLPSGRACPLRPPLHHEPRPLRGLSQRTTRRRPALYAWLDLLPPPAAIPDLL